MEKTIYLIIKDGKIIAHTNIAAMLQLDGVTFGSSPEHISVSESEYAHAGGTAHINSSGQIILGLSPEQTARKDASERLMEIDARIKEIESKRQRSHAAIVQAGLDGVSPNKDDVDTFTDFNREISDLRIERKEKEAITKV
jgi:hypothetical protein